MSVARVRPTLLRRRRAPDAAPKQRAGLTRTDLKEFFPRARLSSRVVALPDLGIVYVKNPKAASSTLLLWLDRLHTGEHDLASEYPHRDNRLPSADDVGWDVVSRMLTGGAFRFAFVRDPLRRLESAYFNKVARRTHWRTEVQATLGLPEDRESPVTFEQFVTAVELQEPLTMDLHWRPQHLNLMHPMVEYDHVGHVERFDQDLSVVRRQAGLPEVPVEPRAVSRRKRTGSVYDGRPDLVRRVEQIYATDIELYGY
jgi:hypothetical protein